MRKMVKILFLLAFVLLRVDGLKILGFFPHPGRSHHDVFNPVLEELAARGHDLTIISHFEPPTPIKGWTQINMGLATNLTRETLDFNMFETDYPFLQKFVHMRETFIIIEIAKNMCDRLTKLPQVHDILNNKEKFDVILVEFFNSECALGIAHFIDAPIIGMQSHPFMPWTLSYFAQPSFPAYVPLIVLSLAPHMTFLERVENQFFEYFYTVLFNQLVFNPEREILQRNLNRTVPPLFDIGRTSSALLSNTHFTLHGAKPLLPGIVEASGMHVRKYLKPLDLEIEQFMNASKNGVVVFSMGSMLRTSTMPLHKRDAFLDAFSKIDYEVIWKWEGEPIPNLPKNVFLKKWLPQLELMHHPKTVAFISHGGLLGTTEAIHCGVPMLFIPVFADQGANSAAAVEAGLGKRVLYGAVTKETVYEALTQVLTPEMRESAKSLSMQWHDRTPPLQLATETVEYVAKYKGRHLRSPALDLYTYQALNLDVMAFFLVILFVLFGSILLLIRSALRLCFGKSTPKKTELHINNNNKYKQS